MSEDLYLLTICLGLGTILLIFGMRYGSAVAQARARLTDGDACRQIAEKAAMAQVETSAALTAIQTTLAEVRTRLAAMEKVLKDVE